MSTPQVTTGQVVVVTGASSGVGRAVARAYGKRGARVGLIARDEIALHLSDALQFAIPDYGSDRASAALEHLRVAFLGVSREARDTELAGLGDEQRLGTVENGHETTV